MHHISFLVHVHGRKELSLLAVVSPLFGLSAFMPVGAPSVFFLNQSFCTFAVFTHFRPVWVNQWHGKGMS